ncbi:transketolase [Pseudalkalibacillus caeni]|uniref:Transketolase n=1 Tax=Exobacillus caeni TaxID=2574798 RepID=A0A5R9F506_9BACL|nr:transketolase [Pseudalkalibacillus caeni]TLS37426.1 transketolase [Pseudalkalibacillus caeni]
MTQNIDQLAINTIRTLSIDAVEKAQSGHPGMPMGAAPMAYELWKDYMNHNPGNPEWFNRDRFVLSAGHGSMLLYSLLHLFGYDVSMEDLKNFRQWGSKTPGHPEYGDTPGVDATTGPLGQGIAMAVGMAMAERHLASQYNKEGFPVVDHYTYAICGDGDLMEGVASEASSLAGHLKLGRLVLMYDSNDISLDGDLDLSFTENVQKRFESYGWEVIRVEDGTDIDSIGKAIEKAKENEEQPTLIEVKTVIGYGSPNKSGKSASHGAPLGESELKLTKEAYKWDFQEDFHVPEEVQKHFAALKEQGQKKEAEWNELVSKYEQKFPELASQLKNAIEGTLPEGWDNDLPTYQAGDKQATRAISGEVINAIAKAVPQFFGGAADLAGSNKTLIKDGGDFFPGSYNGRNVWFGVREFAMGAAMNGMALHKGLKPFGGTFFAFSDYMRPAIRLAALMKQPVSFVFTHDSIALGEDGPTHQPIEQLPSLRAMPNLTVLRPADANETKVSWKVALESQDRPSALVLTRQGLPTLDSSSELAEEGVRKGAYVVSEAEGKASALLLASGSEVSLAVEAQKALKEDGINVSVVSMPAWNLFDEQSDEYKESVLPSSVKYRLAIEMAAPFGWEKYTGDKGEVLGINRFGASAPAEKLMEEYGFTVENVVSKVKAMLNK